MDATPSDRSRSNAKLLTAEEILNMPTTSETVNNATTSAQDQIRQLRDQVDTLMRERVTPMIADAAGRAQDAAQKAQDIAGDQIEALSTRVRKTPISAILVAAAAGFILGRIAR
jgi:ElaB/YqjD/DUF883 family membrane-anchored ribosome-binding protein